MSDHQYIWKLGIDALVAARASRTQLNALAAVTKDVVSQAQLDEIKDIQEKLAEHYNPK